MSVVAERIRDSTRLASTNADLLYALTIAQQITNVLKESVFETLSLVTVPHISIYPVLATTPKAVRIVSVRQDERDLQKVSPRQLREADSQWLRRTGPRYEQFAMIGRGMLTFYPRVANAVTLQVRYLKHTDILDSTDDTIELPDKDVPTMLTVAEVLLGLRMRNFTQVAPLLEELARTVGGGAE